MKRKTIKADEYNVVSWMRPYIGYLAGFSHEIIYRRVR